MPVLLLACAEGAIGLSEVSGLEAVPGTGAEPTEPDAGRVFGLDTVHAVEITVEEDDLRSLDGDPYTFVRATMRFDGAEYPGVGVRIKGRLGSLRGLDAKSAFKVDMNAFGGEGEVEGLDALNFNNMVQDCSQVHELAAYAVYRAAGIAAPRVGYAWIRVNREDFGLYSIVEEYDDEFLDANYADATGNLYDGDYHLWPDGSYTLIDFSTSSQEYFELDEGADVGRADIHAITDAVAATRGTDSFSPVVGALVDLDHHARYHAAEAWIGQYDGYTYYSNNYRVYFDPADGLARLHPWDPDWAFYESTPVASPYGSLSAACRDDTTCHAAFLAAIEAIGDAVPGSGVPEDVDRAIELIRPWVARDPRLEGSAASVAGCQADLGDWLDTRAQTLADWRGL